MQLSAIGYIKNLDLLPHPEGGYYKETYRSASLFEGTGDFPASRAWSTAIYFLLEENNFSAFHKIKSDETWHFYAGNALEVIELDNAGNLQSSVVGPDILNGQVLQYTVAAGNWFASRVLKGGSFSLVGCTVSPGFDFRDFEMADRNELLKSFPKHNHIITELTR
ncbi:MAG: cupin domain-containing protein [Bacteroidetes bacterium]|nr:cupin domain-containing protein [Bacteroidota bacterium]